MTIDDRILGLVLAGFGAAVAWLAQGFPLMAGMPYGPGFFPTIAAVGLIICGLVIAAGGVAARRATTPGGSAPPPATRDARASERAGASQARASNGTDALAPPAPEAADHAPATPVGPGGVLRLLAVLGLVALAGVALDPLGFHVTAALVVLGAAILFGAGPLTAVILAAVAAPLTHAIFYSVLRVPLPWGLLEPYAW